MGLILPGLPVSNSASARYAEVFLACKARLRFRLNRRALDAKDHPAQSLLTRDVLFTVPDDAGGWQHIDLKPYDVNVAEHKRVAVTIKWLDQLLQALEKKAA